MNADVQQATQALAGISLDNSQSLKELKDFLSKYTEAEILGHFVNKPLPDAPALLEHAIGIMVDLEWHQQPINDPIPELDGRITQTGFTIFRLAALRDCKTPEDFLPLLKTAFTHFFRIVENCHLRMKSEDFKDTETTSLFCPTRFVNKDDMKATLRDVLDNQRLADGTRAPVMLLGHGWDHDEARMREDWDFHTNKMNSIVRTMKSIGKVAAQAGIVPTPDKTRGETHPNFDKMLHGFQIETTGIWRHNGANDAVYQLTLVFLIALSPILFPAITSGYPMGPTIAGRSVNEIWVELAKGKATMAPLPIGHAQFCFYCETAEDHDADVCPVKHTIVCELCKNAGGKPNARYRKGAKGHQTSRCGFHFKHHSRHFPEWLEQRNLSLEDKRKLSRGMALADFEMIGEVFHRAILGGQGPMGNDEVRELVANEKKRMEHEAGFYSVGDSGIEEEEDIQD